MNHLGRLQPCSLTLEKAGKAYKGQTLWLFIKVVTYIRKKFYNIGHRVLDGSMYPGLKLVCFALNKKNYGAQKYNSLYIGQVLPSWGDRA